MEKVSGNTVHPSVFERLPHHFERRTRRFAIDPKNLLTPDILLVPGDVCPFSQFRTLVLSHPMIFATSSCRSPRSSRRFRIASPRVLTVLGYALSLGFLAFNRTRQKSNATSCAHCHREHELRWKSSFLLDRALEARRSELPKRRIALLAIGVSFGRQI